MSDFSLIEKFRILMNVIFSSPLFLITTIIAILLLIFFVISIVSNKKINKWIFLIPWILLGLVIVIRYNKIFIELIDNLFDSLFSALYFPNLAVYIILIAISNFFFIYSILDKKMDKLYKILNISNAFIINIILLIIMDIVNKKSINIYDDLQIFSNSNLLVLLQLSTAIFTSWILLNLLISAHKKLKRYDIKEKPEMPEIIFD